MPIDDRTHLERLEEPVTPPRLPRSTTEPSAASVAADAEINAKIDAYRKGVTR